MALGAVVTLLQTVGRLLEDLWIEREALGWHLQQRGYTGEELKKILADAKLDPQLREQARAAYAQMRESLEKAGSEAVLEALADTPPPSGEPN